MTPTTAIHRHRVLVVDDDEEVRITLASILKTDDYTVFTAKDAEEALRIVEAQGLCIILLDVAMPKMDGFDLCRCLREDPKLAHVPIAMVTGCVTDEDFNRGIAAGASDYIKKPFDRAELRVRVRNLVMLHESYRRHQALFDNTSQGIIATSTETKSPIMVNRAFCDMLGYSEAELRNLSVTDLHPDCFIPELLREIPSTEKREHPLVGDIPFKKKNGEIFFTDLSTFPMTLDGVLCSVAFVTDITERKKMEQRLKEEEQHFKWMEAELLHAQKLEAVGRLASGIAHEINTPTQFVGDNTRFLKDAFSDLFAVIEEYEALAAAVRDKGEVDAAMSACESAVNNADLDFLKEEIPRAATQTLEGVDRIASIVRAMKEFAHPGSDQKVWSDINKLIQTTATVSKNEWKYSAEMKLELDSTLPQVLCLPGEINQVFLNLIVNAAHAVSDAVKAQGDTGGAKKLITIRTAVVDAAVEIRIADTGTGIPENIRSKIMEPFFTTKEVGKGTGQGLAIARSVIVDKHGGRLFFETEVGRGTTFVIQLPIAESGPAV